MKKTLAVFLLALSLAACANSPYITTCTDPECSVTAKKFESVYQDREGISVTASPFLEFKLNDVPEKIGYGEDILVVRFKDDKKIVISSLNTHVFEFPTKEKINMLEFMQWVYLRDFKEFKATNATDEALHAVRSFKMLSNGEKDLSYFKRDNLTVYFSFTQQDKQHKIYITNDNFADEAIDILLFNFTHNDLNQLLATLTGKPLPYNTVSKSYNSYSAHCQIIQKLYDKSGIAVRRN